MPNTTRVVNGTLTKADNTAWVGQTITFETALPTYTATSQVPVASVSVTTGAGGAFTVTLICTTEFIVRSEYKVTYPSGTSTTFRYFELPAGSAIELSVLLEASNPVSVAPSTLLAQLDALIATEASTRSAADTALQALVDANTTAIGTKLAKASNLSDLASVSTARTNLGLGSLALLSSITASQVSDFSTAVDARIKLLQKWALNFTGNGDVYIPAYEAMTVDAGTTAIGTGTIVYAKSTTAAPSTFSTTTLPATLEAGAWLKVTVSAIGTFKVLELRRTA